MNSRRHSAMLFGQPVERVDSRRIAQHNGNLPATRHAFGLALGASLWAGHALSCRMISRANGMFGLDVTIATMRSISGKSSTSIAASNFAIHSAAMSAVNWSNMAGLLWLEDFAAVSGKHGSGFRFADVERPSIWRHVAPARCSLLRSAHDNRGRQSGWVEVWTHVHGSIPRHLTHVSHAFTVRLPSGQDRGLALLAIFRGGSNSEPPLFNGDANQCAGLFADRGSQGSALGKCLVHGYLRSEEIPLMSESYSVTSDNATAIPEAA